MVYTFAELNEAGKTEFIVSIVYGVLATTTTALRFWSRRRTDVAFWWDDWSLILGMIALYVMIALHQWGKNTKKRY